MKKAILVLFVLTLSYSDSFAQILVSVGGKEPILRIGGLIQVQADVGDRGDTRFTTSNDRIYLRRARLNVSGSFLEEFDFKLELDLSGSLGNNASISTNLRAQMTDGYINWNKHPFANIKGGQFKTGFGFEQIFPDPKLYTIERSLPNDRLTVSRQIGVQVAGDFFEKRLSYATGFYNGTGLNTTANDNDSFLYMGRAVFSPYQKKSPQEISWNVGINAFRSDDTDLSQPADIGLPNVLFTGTRTGTGVDSQFKFGRAEFWTEYLRQTLEPVNSPTFKDFTADGWYAQAFYYLIPAKLMVVVKYETFDPNKRTAEDETDTWTAGVNYYFKGDDLCFRVNYLHSDVPVLGAQDKLLVRMQVVF